MIARMDDASQIHIPESFIRLYAPPGRPRPRQLAERVAQRFEICEALTASLAPRAQELQFKLGITEADVIDKMLATLLALTGEADAGEAPGPNEGASPDAAEAVLSVPEARWVVGHLAEQLGWLEHLSPELRAMGTDAG